MAGRKKPTVEENIDEKASESVVDERNEDQSALTALLEDRALEAVTEAPVKRKRPVSNSPEARAKRRKLNQKRNNKRWYRRKAKEKRKEKREQMRIVRAAIKKALKKRTGERGPDKKKRKRRADFPINDNFFRDNRMLSENQMEIVKTILKGNPDGSLMDRDQILNGLKALDAALGRTDKSRNRQSFICAMDRLLAKRVVIIQGYEQRSRGKPKVLYSLSAEGYRWAADKY